MEVLHIELDKDATRRSIFGQIVVPLDSESRAKVGAVVGDISIRGEQRLHNLGEVEAAINKTVASEWAKEQAKEVYRILAQAEAQVHDSTLEKVHFHEVGLGMTVREVLGICTNIECLNPERITATPVQFGSGQVECEHGILDIPAPATAAVAHAYGIPAAKKTLEGELCTPTSAALIAHFVDEFV